MKKFFAIAIIATAFVACNNSGKKDGDKDSTGTKDSTPAVVTPPAPPANDSTGGKDTMPMKDSGATKM